MRAIVGLTRWVDSHPLAAYLASVAIALTCFMSLSWWMILTLNIQQ